MRADRLERWMQDAAAVATTAGNPQRGGFQLDFCRLDPTKCAENRKPTVVGGWDPGLGTRIGVFVVVVVVVVVAVVVVT